MSIIYEALQKTQKKRSGRWQSGLKYTLINYGIDILIYGTAIILFAVMAYLYHPKIKQFYFSKASASISQPVVPKIQQVQPVVAQTIAKPVSTPTIYATGHAGNITLNGIFISDNEKIALINNQTYHVGDLVEGMTLVRIEFNKVQFKGEKSSLVIRTLA